MGMDFNPTYFAHPKAADGLTLAHPDEAIRRFWVEHGIACRKIGAAMGRALGTPCVTNVWIPDGMKDVTIDRKAPRERLKRSLDEMFAEPLDPAHNLDAVEAKLFGIGSETYVVGSHEFYLGYAVQNNKLLCLDAGHFHPTETIADKISSVLLYVQEILLHVSRGIRWDSDHVVILTDDLRAIAEEIVRGGIPESGPHRAGLFRRQHQSRRRLGHRHPRHDQGAAGCIAGTDRTSCGTWNRTAITQPGWPCWKKPKRCRWAPSGITTAFPQAFRPAWPGSTAFASTSPTCWPNAADPPRSRIRENSNGAASLRILCEFGYVSSQWLAKSNSVNSAETSTRTVIGPTAHPSGPLFFTRNL